jgi:hypothetical protein
MDFQILGAFMPGWGPTLLVNVQLDGAHPAAADLPF